MKVLGIGVGMAKRDLKNRMLLVCTAFLAVVVLVHILRIVRGWSLVIQSFSVPLWMNAVAVIALLIIIFFNVKAYKQ